jgi:anhydro-N-acetylmuramic acid kinase
LRYVGSISGTSVDGLDLAVLRIEQSESGERLKLEAATTVALPAALRDRLLELANPGYGELDLLGQCDTELGDFIGHAIVDFIADCELTRADIHGIGSHGQTVRHRPPPHTSPFTVQIGDPNRIAELTGITTVADFRRRDMAAGGQGAPLVPPFHAALFGHTDKKRGILNIGGISNITRLQPALSGFDTGPGNGLLDLWTAQHLGEPYDKDGQWASTGQIDIALLNLFKADPYFAVRPPKSTGREYFNRDWLLRALETTNTTPQNVQATLVELTAQCSTDACPDLDEIIVCGGGRLNRMLMKRLAANTSAQITSAEDHGFDGDAIEAAAFAWFSHRTLHNHPSNAPAVTGAAGYRVLGGIYPAGTQK